MNSKTIGLLVAAALIIGLVAAVTLRSSSETPAPAEPTFLIPGFGDKINSVARLELAKGKDALTIVRTGSGKDSAWVVENRSNYPAKFDKVKELLVALNDVKLLEKKTDRPERFSSLEVEDVAPSSKSASVLLKDDKNTLLASLVIGKMATGPGGRSGDGAFLRKGGDNQVWQSTLKTTLDLNIISWIDPIVMQLERARIRAVAAAPASGEGIRISKAAPGDANFTLENKPANKELKYAGAADTPSFAMEYLDMTDVAPLASVDFTKEPLGTTTCSTFDGLVATATLARADGKTWIKLSFATDFTNVPDVPADAEKKPDAPADASKEAPKSGKSHAEVTQEAATLNARHSPWAYQVVDYKAGQFLPKLADVLKDPEPAGPAAPGGGQNGAQGGTPPLLQQPPR